jgi:hypothetical protein
MSAQPEKNEPLRVFISGRDSVCEECKEKLGRQAWITLQEGVGALCLSCADLDELEFLPTGDAALTRRSNKYSALTAVVLKFSRARKRYERQGLLVEAQAIERAESECFADQEVRERRRERAALQRKEADQDYIKKFAARVRELFPRIPKGREKAIAEHACRKYSGRVGRSAFAKALDETAVHLAVVAHIRHRETHYDELPMRGFHRGQARSAIAEKVDRILESWGQAESAGSPTLREHVADVRNDIAMGNDDLEHRIDAAIFESRESSRPK